MSEGYRVDLVELQRLADRAAAIEKNILERLELIDKQTAELHLTWDSPAAAAHQDAHGRWSKAARGSVVALKGLRGGTQRACDNYQGGVDACKGSWPE
jgi:uncharacterized protein YukE